jgi:ABC-2 type transport system permease protein
MLAKNLFHSVLFALDALLVTVLASLRYGMPSAVMLAAAWAWVLFALPVHLAAGNLFSLWMPYRINLGRIGRQKGAQANALLSMLVQAGVLGAGALVFFLCSYFARLWLAIPVLIVMAAGAVVFWLWVLARVDSIVGRCREDLIAELVRTE